MSEDGEQDREVPPWARCLIAAMVVATGAALGGVAGGSRGAVAAFGFMLPNALLGILLVLEVFSCAT